jgi:membrane protein implicated in regulation of membrane protease activity
MPWWGWLIVGLLLLGSELLIVDAAFYLVFVGAAAVLTGLLVMAGLATEYWVQWLLFAIFAIATMIVFRRRFYEKLRGGGAEYQDGMAGEIIQLEEPLDPGASCRLSYRGTPWTVINRGSVQIAAGLDVKIEKTDGLSIIVTGNS